MIIRPRDRGSVLIIARVSRLVRVLVFRVKEMRAAHAPQGAERRSQILMIARRENSAASLPEARNALTICDTQPITRIDCEKPYFIKLARVELAQHLVVAVGVRLAIPRSYLIKRFTMVVGN